MKRGVSVRVGLVAVLGVVAGLVAAYRTIGSPNTDPSASAAPQPVVRASPNEPAPPVNRLPDRVLDAPEEPGHAAPGVEGAQAVPPSLSPVPSGSSGPDQVEAGDERVVYPCTAEGVAASMRQATPAIHECLLGWAGDVSSFQAQINYSFVVDVSDEDPDIAHPRDVQLVTDPMPDVVAACLTSVMADQYFEPPAGPALVVEDRLLVSLEF